MNSGIVENIKITKNQALKLSMIDAKNNNSILINKLQFKMRKMVIKLCYMTYF